MRLLVIDNYDSFVYNIVHILKELGAGDSMDIYRNNKISLDEVGKYDKVLLSPGPGIPSEAGILLDVVRKYGDKKSILGVCLGHQGIAEVYGASLYNLPEVIHGMAVKDNILEEDTLFKGLPSSFMVARYHSWAVDPSSDLSQLVITSKDDSGNIMSFRHKQYDVRGVQFHPESVLTEHGKKILENWLKA
jgi:anthranilate synthase component 2